MRDEIDIEIAYGTAQVQKLYRLRVAAGTTAAQAVRECAVWRDFPDADPAAPLGIFGKRISGDTVLQAHDRVEIYRPLLADPKQARRNRAANRKNKNTSCFNAQGGT
ncbi:RnfH family protein [Conchiformibius kuhniae]|uniref:UPF0125 protein LVJ77_01265 n=1 Tax=Conchiformibius kuhniae TaxID=211502 RepID=A0A8T9MUN5_9NEIS|nr:RnfH family protein [Conchiformibius kuhniae]UOP04989.1 RnfH family protein [Conchiformibius kuhniae]